jgi:hypothetical protein
MAGRNKKQLKGSPIGNQLDALASLMSQSNDIEMAPIERNAGYSYAKRDWDEIRKAYILGKRIIEKDENGIERIWSENYTVNELAELFEIPYRVMSSKAHFEGWKGLREAYLVKVQKDSIDRELGYFASEELRAQQQALQATKNIANLVNISLNRKYGALLEAYEESGEDTFYIELDQPVILEDLNEAVKLLSNNYKLQKTVMESVPRTDTEMLDELNKTKAVSSLSDRKEREKLKTLLMQKLKMLNSLDD